MSNLLSGSFINLSITDLFSKSYNTHSSCALISLIPVSYTHLGIAGFSHVVDSLSAIKYAKVKAIRDEDGIIQSFETTGDFPRYGNDDDRADEIAVKLLKTFMGKVKKCHTYRNSEPTTSILTITRCV